VNPTERKEIRTLLFMAVLVISAGEIAEYFLDISPYLLGITRGFGFAAFVLLLIKYIKSKKAL